MEDLSKKIENEQVARKNLEALILKERKEAEKRIKESEAQLDNITMNFQMAVASKSSAEAKNNTLNDQKKVLVKEVKQLRKKLDDANVSIDELKVVNEKLVAATNSLQQQLKAALASLEICQQQQQQQRQQNGEAVEEYSTKEKDSNAETTTDAVTAESVDELLKQSNLYTSSVRSHQEGEGSRSATPNPRTPEAEDQHRKERQMSINSVDDSDERMSWDMPAASLRELGWLTAEQNKLVEKRISDKPNSRSASPTHAQSTEDHARLGSTLSMFSSVLGSVSTTGSTETHDNQSNSGSANRRSSLQMISSMFSSTSRQQTPNEKKEEKEAQPTPEDVHKAPDGSRLFFSSPFSNHFDDDESNAERLPKSMRLQCLRCQGTVEGPKFSTCKCVIPALSPDDLNSNNHNGGTLNMLSGFAGGLAGGLMKATVATASSVSGLVHYSTTHTGHSVDSKPTHGEEPLVSAHGEEPLLDLSEPEVPFIPSGLHVEDTQSNEVVDSDPQRSVAVEQHDSEDQTSL